MGTTLTGTTPQDTYDSLIKVTDNGPISGTLKALSDGLGNDSTLSLSTTAASIAGTLAVAGAATFDTTTLVVDAANNRVGINKATPTSDLDVSGTFAASSSVTAASLLIGNTDGLCGNINSSSANGGYFTWQTSNTTIADIGTAQQIFGSGGNDTFGINARAARSLVFGSNNAERVRITSAGNVGIGLDAPANRLVVKAAGYGAIASFLDTADNGFVFKADAFNGFNAIDQTQQLIMNFGGAEKYRFNTDGVLAVGSGIQFPATQVASANVNTLDDYEEGTWTPTVLSAGYTLATSEGTYTKIGRQFTLRAQINFSAVNALSSSSVQLTGLPFIAATTFAGAMRDDTTSGAVYTLTALSTSIFAGSYSSVITGSARPFAINENYVLTVTCFV